MSVSVNYQFIINVLMSVSVKYQFIIDVLMSVSVKYQFSFNVLTFETDSLLIQTLIINLYRTDAIIKISLIY
jgi:hypothetical protein